MVTATWNPQRMNEKKKTTEKHWRIESDLWLSDWEMCVCVCMLH